MRRLFISAVTAVSLMASGLLFARSGSVRACSADPSFDPVAASDVIVGGLITGWTPLPAEQSGMFIAVRLDRAPYDPASVRRVSAAVGLPRLGSGADVNSGRDLRFAIMIGAGVALTSAGMALRAATRRTPALPSHR